ncbi:hypothetical protein JHD50_09370 [Sulfurimonas sp. MAG313]|nr:hypothetical protein [Sulfurimonas sp. MAG313]MDF1881507.1 hypothetical protein [Sulfurimonas sp. MAG313]
MRDAYEALIPGYISKEEFFRFGLEQTIYISDEKVKMGWEALKKKLKDNKPLFMRGSKDAAHNQMYYEFYARVLRNEQAKRDPSNSQTPTKMMEELSGLKKSKDLKNYQLSTIFGRSKNVLCFNAPWNFAYTPNILDPLLGVDARGPLAQEFKKVFQAQAYKKFKPYIEEFNTMMTDNHFLRETDEYLHDLYDNSLHKNEIVEIFESSLRDEIEPISI